MENEVGGETEPDIYLSFSGVIDSPAVTKIAGAMNLAVNKGYKHVYFCLNSLGGYIGDGVALYNHLRGLPIQLTMHNTGNVSSIAVTVFLAAERRYTSLHGMFLIHPTTVTPNQALAWERLDALLKSSLADEARVDDILRDRCGTIPQEILAGRRSRDTYLTPQHAVEYGIAHGIREFSLPRGKEIFQI